MLITPALKAALKERGVESAFPGAFQLPDDTLLEPPLSLKRMNVAYRLEMGAFSYAESGYFFGVKIGRYCSIGERVQIGRGSHPIDWFSTSPLFYQPHRAVFDKELPEAAEYKLDPARPLQQAKMTVIGNDVQIGYGALISQGVTIHDGAVVEPRAVVTKDVPHFAIVAGNPAVVVGMRFPPAMSARILHLAWWRFAFWDLPGTLTAQPGQFLDMVRKNIDAGMQPYEPERVILREFASKT